MPRLVVNNTTFNYPDPGQEPGWGEDATAWASAVTEALGFLLAPGDIINGTSTIANNVANSDVLGCQFDNTQTRAANVTYQITRQDGSNTFVEYGTLYISYNSATTAWTLARSFTGDSCGVSFTITSAGQVKYTSTNYTNTPYSGIIKFNAKTLRA